MSNKELFKIAQDTAYDAGSFLRDLKSSEKKIYSEEGKDIKLEIDRLTEERIKSSLSQTSLPILGEEFGGEEIADGKTMWVIDPLDGTSNYFRNLDQCCVSIALLNGMQGEIGVIYNFNTNEMFCALRGHGAYLNDEKIRVSDVRERSKGYLTTGFPSSKSIDPDQEFLSFLEEWRKVRMFGSAAISCAYVASGKCDFYSETGVYLWDFAAGLCLISEAGGITKYQKYDESRYFVEFSNGLL